MPERTWLVRIPRLVAEPVVAAGCCAVPALEIVLERLAEVENVRLLEAKEDGVVVTEETGVGPSLEAVNAALSGTGYLAASIETLPSRPTPYA